MADALELGPDDYSQIYSFLTSDNPSERTLGQQMSKKLTAKEQQAFFDFQKTFAVKDAERNRVDNSVGGLPPEMAALSLGNVGRAIGGAGLTAAQRAVAGVKAVAGQAAPVIKYELVKGGLHAMGAPEPIPMVGGMLASGYRMGKAAPSAAAPAAAEAAPAAMSDIQLAQQELAAGRLTPQQYANIARSQAQRPPVAPQGPPAPAPMPPPVARPAAPEPVPGPSEPPPTPTEAPKPAGPPSQKQLNEEALARRRAAYQESLKAQPEAAAPADPAAALKASSSFANLPTDAERTFPPNKSGLPFNAPRVVKARGKIADLADMPPSEPAAAGPTAEDIARVSAATKKKFSGTISDLADVPEAGRQYALQHEAKNLTPEVDYALKWIEADMEHMPFNKRTVIPHPEPGHGGDTIGIGGSAGSKIYRLIVGQEGQQVSGAGRADVIKAIKNLRAGKVTPVGELVLGVAKDLSGMSMAQLQKIMETGPP